MQEEKRQQGSGRCADLQRMFEALFNQKTSNDEDYGYYDDVHNDDDADCNMD